MKNFSTDIHDNDTRFDRLADGELPEEEYRQLLATLDDEPGGWRRCAMAFLEAQAWRRDVQSLRDPRQRKSRSIQRISRMAKRTRLPGSLGLLLSMAASFLVAFGLGVMVTRGWSQATPSGQLPAVAGQSSSDARQADYVDASEANSIDRTPHLASSDSPDESQRVDGQLMPTERQPAGHVRLVVGDENPGNDTVEMPFYEMNPFDPRWLADEQLPLPLEVVRAFERIGHQVRRDRRFVSVGLHDGRRVFMPVDQVEIVPVSGGDYR